MISPPEPQSGHPACDQRRPSSTSQVKASRRFRELGIFLALTAMVVCLLVLAPGFRTVDNLINITRNFAFVGIVAMGRHRSVRRKCLGGNRCLYDVNAAGRMALGCGDSTRSQHSSWLWCL